MFCLDGFHVRWVVHGTVITVGREFSFDILTDIFGNQTLPLAGTNSIMVLVISLR